MRIEKFVIKVATYSYRVYYRASRYIALKSIIRSQNVQLAQTNGNILLFCERIAFKIQITGVREVKSNIIYDQEPQIYLPT